MLRVTWAEVAVVAALAGGGALAARRWHPLAIMAVTGGAYAALDHYVLSVGKARRALGSPADQLAAGVMPL